jgi:transcriptional regulator with XRE-family HTH domain
MAKVKELLATNLKFGRVRLGFSRERMAELSGLSPAHIKDLEEGKSYVSAEEFERLSEALGRKPYEMLYEGDEWESRDSLTGLADLHIELKEKINDLLDRTIHNRLGF